MVKIANLCAIGLLIQGINHLLPILTTYFVDNFYLQVRFLGILFEIINIGILSLCFSKVWNFEKRLAEENNISKEMSIIQRATTTTPFETFPTDMHFKNEENINSQ
jgi:hypothetical protein